MKYLPILDTFLMILLIVIFIYIYKQEEKRQVETIALLNQIKNK